MIFIKMALMILIKLHSSVVTSDPNKTHKAPSLLEMIICELSLRSQKILIGMLYNII